jgi:hypothetical protein
LPEKELVQLPVAMTIKYASVNLAIEIFEINMFNNMDDSFNSDITL